MTYDHQQQPDAYNPHGHAPTGPWAPMAPPPAPPKKKHRARNWTLGILGALVVGGIIAGTVNNTDAPKAAPSKPVAVAPSSSAAPTVDNSTNVATNPEPAYVVPSTRNIRITLKTLTKDCFDTAGCNITYRPQVTQLVPAGSFDPTVTYDVTYDVRGSTGGAQTGTLTLQGDGYTAESEDLAQTPTEGTKLTAVITTIEAE